MAKKIAKERLRPQESKKAGEIVLNTECRELKSVQEKGDEKIPNNAVRQGK